MIGEALVEQLYGVGQVMRAFFRAGSRIKHLDHYSVELFDTDFSAPRSLSEALGDADTVYNLAAETRTVKSQDEYDLVNVEGLRSLLDASLAANVRRFVQVSCAQVCPPASIGKSLDEKSEEYPTSEYLKSKLLGEKICQDYARRFPELGVVIIRLAKIIGPTDPFTVSIIEALRRGQATLPRDSDRPFSLLYVKDAASAIRAMSKANVPAGEVYIASGFVVTPRELLNEFASSMGMNPKIERPSRTASRLSLFFHNRLTGKTSTTKRLAWQNLHAEGLFSSTKALTDLGFDPAFGISETAKETIYTYDKSKSTI